MTTPKPGAVEIQRYNHVYGENPMLRAHMTSILVPDYYNGTVVKYVDHERTVAALAAELATLRALIERAQPLLTYMMEGGDYSSGNAIAAATLLNAIDRAGEGEK